MEKKGSRRRIIEERIKKEDWKRKDRERRLERGGWRRRIREERIKKED